MAGTQARPSNGEKPLPPVTREEAARIVGRLGPALRAHGLWIYQVHTALICRVSTANDGLEPDASRRSELGRWLGEETNEFIRRHSAFAAAAEEHERLHGLARRLCEAARTGRPIQVAEYQTFADCISRLDHSLEALVKELWNCLRHTDPLTGIATRHGMLPRMREERRRAQRTGLVSSICMADLDRFKQINDTHGHVAGDTVLEAVSRYFTANLRRYDQVCRYGGEEFVLLLPDTEPEQAGPIIDRLRRGLAEMPIRLGTGQPITVTASFGIAPLMPREQIATSIERADQAMYLAKRSGRNQVRIWAPKERTDSG